MDKQHTNQQRGSLRYYNLTEPEESETSSNPFRSNDFSVKDWLLLLLPFLLVGASLLYLNLKFEQAKPTVVAQPQVAAEAPAESTEFAIDKYLVPQAGVIQIVATNGSDTEVTIPQVTADDAYWAFDATPSTLVPPGGVVTFTLPYPWVAGELPEVRLITSHGETIDSEVEPTVEISGEVSATTSSQ